MNLTFGKNHLFNITGTLIWYYYICPREVWLMSRQIELLQENPNIEIGRLFSEWYYQRNKKEIYLENMIIDIIRKKEDQIIVGEVKKSSKYEKSAKMQLIFYLYKLNELGINIAGELLFPKEKKRVKILLTQELKIELEKAIKEITEIIKNDKIVKVEKIPFCKNCAYREFCWS